MSIELTGRAGCPHTGADVAGLVAEKVLDALCESRENLRDIEGIMTDTLSAAKEARAAQAAAEAAKEKSEAAQIGAEAARAGAGTAQVAAEAAMENAETARAAAEEALNAGESAQAAAETAQAGAEAAKDVAEAARQAVENLSVAAVTGAAGSAATVRKSVDAAGAVTLTFTVPQGEVGKSAYAIAQEGGYTGTEAEFMAELGSVGRIRDALDVMLNGRGEAT